jgi:hypothetical protein
MPTLALLPPEDRGWRAFAEAHATSPVQHPAWLDAITGAYRLEARIIALGDSRGAILAALPTIGSKLPWRRRWTSLPFTDALEPVAVSPEHRDELLIAAADEAEIQPIIIRTLARLPGWCSREVGTVHAIDLSDGAEGVLRGASKGHRRNVKRAQRSGTGLSVRPITSRSEFLGASLSLTARSRRRLGAPTQPRRFWSQVWKLHDRDEALTIGVYLAGRLVANGTFILGSDHAVFKYAASDAATWHLRPNHLMFATAFDHIATRGLKALDFGVTDLRNTTLRDFKSSWGGEERPAYYSATDARLLPDMLEPGRLLSETIQHAPVSVGRAIGSLAYPFVA